jgi:hypothetical protein
MYKGWAGMLKWVTSQIKIMFLLMTTKTAEKYLYMTLFLPFFVVLTYVTFPYIIRIVSLIVSFVGRILAGLASAGIWGLLTGLLLGIFGAVWIGKMVVPIFTELIFSHPTMESTCVPIMSLEKGYIYVEIPWWSPYACNDYADNLTITNPIECPVGYYLISPRYKNSLVLEGHVWAKDMSLEMRGGETKIFRIGACPWKPQSCGKQNFTISAMSKDTKQILTEVTGIVEAKC